MSKHQYIQVILPLALPKLYTYRIPIELQSEVVVGKRVEVQFGRRRLYAALVHEFCGQPEDISQVKEIMSILDDAPIVSEWQFRFWQWISDYYMCSMGEVMQAALPAAFKLESTSTFLKNLLAEFTSANLSSDEFLIVEAFEFQEALTLENIQDILSRKSVMRVIRNLIDLQIIYIRESLVERYRPKTVAHVELNPAYREEDLMRTLLDGLSRAPKQLALVLSFLNQNYKGEHHIRKSELLKMADAGPASLNSLVDKGVFEIVKVEIDRLELMEAGTKQNELETSQETALTSIRSIFKEKSVCLLHGITSSGKTHLYVELIKEYLADGKQILFLLPEIALTAQLIRRLRGWLGDIGVYHSKFNDSERIEIWNKVASGHYKIIVGARSAMFLPFRSIGLIIVDEEHDISYKQFDPAPRYQARDCAIYLSAVHEAKVVLGSATPSFETYYNARSGKFGHVELNERFGGIHPPEIQISDLLKARKRRQMHGAFSTDLINAITDVVEKKGQVILFQNRRGYAPYLICDTCNWIPYCKNCDVSLTYHKYMEDLRCHYCGYREALMNSCKSCGSNSMQLRGMGTERIEDDLKVIFPSARIARMDWDSVRGKHGHDRIIRKLEDNEIDILVGTQMVTKGLDFENVKLVGVLNADALLYYPDFRAVERAFQVLMQVSGRAGRKGERGKVIIQMSDVAHPLIDFLMHTNGYQNLFANEMMERQAFKYPPYVRLLKIYVKHKDYKIVEKATQSMARMLKQQWGARVIGPVKPTISRVRTLYIREITIKMERKSDVIIEMKASIFKAKEMLNQYQEYRSLRIYSDVDAY